MNRFNAEHYPDPTAAEAVPRADRQPNHVSEFIHFTKRHAAVSGLEIVGRIKVRDRKTGKLYP